MTKYILYTKKAGYQFAPKDGEEMTTEQIARYRHYDNEADATAELIRQYRCQLDGGFRAGGSDNVVHEDAESIADAIEQCKDDETPFDASFYSVAGYYEDRVLIVSDEALENGSFVSFESNNATHTYVVAVEEIEAEEAY